MVTPFLRQNKDSSLVLAQKTRFRWKMTISTLSTSTDCLANWRRTPSSFILTSCSAEITRQIPQCCRSRLVPTTVTTTTTSRRSSSRTTSGSIRETGSLWSLTVRSYRAINFSRKTKTSERKKNAFYRYRLRKALLRNKSKCLRTVTMRLRIFPRTT